VAVRITRTSEPLHTVIRIDGQLRFEDVDELARECRGVEGPLVLELADLQSADPAGVKALLGVAANGAKLQGVSPYIELLLKGKS